MSVTWSAAAMIERLGGDDALARQLVTLFLDEYPKLLANLRTSVARGNADAIRRAAHATKGCVANFIDSGPQATAHAIEQCAAEGRTDAAAALVPQLERELAVLVRDMVAFEREWPCAS